MTGIVLDASALLAMIKGEPGGERVSEVLAEARINAINFAEVVSHFDFHGTPHAEIEAMLLPLEIDVISPNRDMALLAGKLRAVTATAGLSLGDRFCLAQALTDGMPAWTADKGWSAVAERVGVEVVVIR